MGLNIVPSVLVVDDDAVTRHLLKCLLSSEGLDVTVAKSGNEALDLLSKKEFPLIITDIQMDELDGLTLLSHLKEDHKNSVVIMITGFGSLEGAMEAIQEGAFDYLSKPIRPEELKSIVRRALAHSEWQKKAIPSAPPQKGQETHRTLLGRSPVMVQVYKMIAKASLTMSNVLITGESGTGKELVARAIHNNSKVKMGPFVAVNCSALTDSLLESELFGHVKGAFTGAVASKPGLFEEANGGTLFLDEIGDISPAMQVKLLRVLQEGEFKPVGSNEVRRVTTRVIAATHRNLNDLVDREQFREDLLYRLQVLLVEIPPLRTRMEDLSDLITYFIHNFSRKMNKSVNGLSEDAAMRLKNYHWPGNIRELEHTIERAVAVANSGMLHPEDFVLTQSGTGSENNALTASKSLDDIEKEHILSTLTMVGFNKSRAALSLGIDRATLYRKAQKYGIELSDRRKGKEDPSAKEVHGG